MTIAQILVLGAVAMLLGVAMATDIAARIIPNRLTLAIVALAVCWWWAGHYGAVAVAIQVGAAFAMLILFGCCFAIGAMGGGDVKLIAALALLVPPALLPAMLVWMAIGGGILTLLMLAIKRVRRTAEQVEVPYGVAIAAAAGIVMANRILTMPVA